MVIDQVANTAQLYVDGVAQALSVQTGHLWDRLGDQRQYHVPVSAQAPPTAPIRSRWVPTIQEVPLDMLFAGSIDEVRVYNSALTGPQIFNRYNSDTTLSPEGYWHIR